MNRSADHLSWQDRDCEVCGRRNGAHTLAEITDCEATIRERGEWVTRTQTQKE